MSWPNLSCAEPELTVQQEEAGGDCWSDLVREDRRGSDCWLDLVREDKRGSDRSTNVGITEVNGGL